MNAKTAAILHQCSKIIRRIVHETPDMNEVHLISGILLMTSEVRLQNHFNSEPLKIHSVIQRIVFQEDIF